MKQVEMISIVLHFVYLFLDPKMVDTEIVKTFIKLDNEKDDVEVSKKKVANVVSGSRTAIIDQVLTH